MSFGKCGNHEIAFYTCTQCRLQSQIVNSNAEYSHIERNLGVSYKGKMAMVPAKAAAVLGVACVCNRPHPGLPHAATGCTTCRFRGIGYVPNSFLENFLYAQRTSHTSSQRRLSICFRYADEIQALPTAPRR